VEVQAAASEGGSDFADPDVIGPPAPAVGFVVAQALTGWAGESSTTGVRDDVPAADCGLQGRARPDCALTDCADGLPAD
jgi:hypothetical protein